MKRLIYKDCCRAMLKPLVISLCGDLSIYLVTILTAKVLGNFADAVFKLDIAYARENIMRLLICISLTVFIFPLLELICNISMLKGALLHDRIISSRFLDKEYKKAMALDEGEVQYRLENDPNNFRIYWMDIATKIIVTLISAVVLLFNTLSINIWFGISTICLSLLKLLVPAFVLHVESKFDREEREYLTGVRAYEADIVRQPHIVRLFALKNALCSRLDEKFKSYYHRTMKKSITYKEISGSISNLVNTSASLVIFIVGAVMVANKSISPGSVAEMFGYLAIFDNLLNNISAVVKGIPVIKNISDRLMTIYADSEANGGIDIQDNLFPIIVDNLSYSYDEKGKIIDGLSFNIQKGDKIAICGSNGSGKSTLLKILSGLLKDYDGKITISSSELKELNLDAWRSCFAYAMQDVCLFPGTVYDNIRLGNINATDDRIKNLMDNLGILYLKDMVLDASGGTLSGGEKQRISIARALIRDTPIILLDEPNNSLDADGLNWVCKFIEMWDKTIIYVSHNKRLTACANKVVHL
ncbi:hypothetical protein CDQ84_14885 [Clostridium thermosuccinogenes]|jgi:ATP-binding cassette subfamily B protein|uniref:ABC transporter ATP-binding protein n=1 Tax=Clostridium thermosuccinogenes TaxID=84032 RepID=A0A2K2FCR1_9CLOT|nr:ABC transporter ATP-binding protein [Pseudoclostridium thermosuccinogenes]AUS98148.1 hypothetical protein CDO33_17830 [Pseudoclostridium thermosuccinogenes]PNT91197.1 hypothetical protein CDQ83_15420 [Pseudoclostridium thermosuccinogenes]PNT95381.1 hypothetical protein CDQ85_14970 [Pseudoclostridium thermosuccinogenes]PNT96557.1 hypothetical protein CDQ84_14885 [Pseudoclostridium thermosuccinogenes]